MACYPVTLVESDGDPSRQERKGSRRSEAKADHVLVGNGKNAIGTTISGRAQVINAGGNVVFHGPLPAAGTSKFYSSSIPVM